MKTLKEVLQQAVVADALDSAAVKAAVRRIPSPCCDQRIDLTAPALNPRRNEGGGNTIAKSEWKAT